MKPVIATSIRAGLGNQMFQYAAARSLALRLKGELVLVLEGPEQFALPAFRIVGRTVPAGSVVRAPRGFWPFRRGFWQPPEIPLCHEPFIWDVLRDSPHPTTLSDLLFAPEVLSWQGHIQLRGYWQDERYFATIRPVLRRDFTLRSPLDPRSAACLARIRGGPAAFVHVRRGDYLLPEFRELFGTCSADYYHRALSLLRERVPHVKIYVFSDDPAWVREHAIGGVDAEVVDWNGGTPAHDLALMAACHHGVVANSSFSWWGAWLAERTDSVVIAPRTWYRSVPDYRDMVPSRWIRI